ncbi:hypothetical protein ACFX2I_014504 [Malus domestica]
MQKITCTTRPRLPPSPFQQPHSFRARELFYYMKGDPVDYGEEHNKACGHSQYDPGVMQLPDIAAAASLSLPLLLLSLSQVFFSNFHL